MVIKLKITNDYQRCLANLYWDCHGYGWNDRWPYDISHMLNVHLRNPNHILVLGNIYDSNGAKLITVSTIVHITLKKYIKVYESAKQIKWRTFIHRYFRDYQILMDKLSFLGYNYTDSMDIYE